MKGMHCEIEALCRELEFALWCKEPFGIRNFLFIASYSGREGEEKDGGGGGGGKEGGREGGREGRRERMKTKISKLLDLWHLVHCMFRLTDISACKARLISKEESTRR